MREAALSGRFGILSWEKVDIVTGQIAEADAESMGQVDERWPELFILGVLIVKFIRNALIVVVIDIANVVVLIKGGIIFENVLQGITLCIVQAIKIVVDKIRHFEYKVWLKWYIGEKVVKICQIESFAERIEKAKIVADA